MEKCQTCRDNITDTFTNNDGNNYTLYDNNANNGITYHVNV